jgi:hypothetical protein
MVLKGSAPDGKGWCVWGSDSRQRKQIQTMIRLCVR